MLVSSRTKKTGPIKKLNNKPVPIAFKMIAIKPNFFTKLKFQVQSTHLSSYFRADSQKFHVNATSMQNYFGRCLTLYVSASYGYDEAF
jgi:hypothetical protein